MDESVTPHVNESKREFQDYCSLPYNDKLRDRAARLRKAGNLSEALLWREIKGKKLNGFDFDRQKIIGNYIVDFYCASQCVVIEIDGRSHNEKGDYDARRTAFLESIGLVVIHIGDIDIKHNLQGVLDFLGNHVALREKRADRAVGGADY